ncbi:MAG: L,D-transpeptidase [Minisyncoccia bacterium]
MAVIMMAASLFVSHGAQAHLRHTHPRLIIVVDISAHEMQVSLDGVQRYVWRVATAMSGYKTPRGVFRIHLMDSKHTSSKYSYWNSRLQKDLPAPMPYSLFFSGNVAIHGGTLRKGSHGCIHLGLHHAITLFYLVERVGRRRVRVVVHR